MLVIRTDMTAVSTIAVGFTTVYLWREVWLKKILSKFSSQILSIVHSK